MIKWTAKAVFGVSFFLLSGCAAQTTELPESTAISEPDPGGPIAPTHLDVAYISDGDPDHLLDIYLPDGATGPFPTIFLVHGSYVLKDEHDEIAGYFVDHGYAAVLIEYGDRFDWTGTVKPLTYRDAFCSLAWVHANADTYGIDRERVFIVGEEWGGTIAAQLATVDDTSVFMDECPHAQPDSGWIKGAAIYNGRFITGAEGGIEREWLQAFAGGFEITLQEMVDLLAELQRVPWTSWQDASSLSESTRAIAERFPTYWVDGSEPPFLLTFGPEDDVESLAFADILQSVGVKAEPLLIPSADTWGFTSGDDSFIHLMEAMEVFMNDLSAE